MALWANTTGEVLLTILGLLAVVAAGLLPVYLFAITVKKTILLIAPENRKVKPEAGFWLLVPVYNLAWQFILFAHLADSLAAEYRSRSLELKEDRPLYFTGLMAGVISFAALIPAIAALASTVSLVLYIIYWIKLAEIKKALTRVESSGKNNENTEEAPTPPPSPEALVEVN